MKKWEYMCQRLVYDQPDLEQELNKFGEDGWELVGAANVPVTTSTTRQVVILLFKREVPAGPVKDPAYAGSDAGIHK